MFKTVSRLTGLGLSLIATMEVGHADGPTPPCWPCNQGFVDTGDLNQDCINEFGFGYYYCADGAPGEIYCCPS